MRTVVVSVASAIAALVILSSCAISQQAGSPLLDTDHSTSNNVRLTVRAIDPTFTARTSDLPLTPSATQPPPTATTSASTSSAAPTPPAPPTARVTVRPVTADGRPVAGYQVSTESFPDLMCQDGAFPASPVAVSPNIRWCGPSASYTVACWNSAVPSTVLCLRDPLKRVLVRIKYQGTFTPIAAPRNPVPEELVLDNGMACTIRAGGAGSRVNAHPDWVDYYYCNASGNQWPSISGPNGGNGIDRSAATWTVQLVTGAGTGSESIASHEVVAAYYVGTA